MNKEAYIKTIKAEVNALQTVHNALGNLVDSLAKTVTAGDVTFAALEDTKRQAGHPAPKALRTALRKSVAAVKKRAIARVKEV